MLNCMSDPEKWLGCTLDVEAGLELENLSPQHETAWTGYLQAL
jgi:hypothetical protein